MDRYMLRPASANDLPMLRRWLASPECVRWWGDPEEQYALLEKDLSNPLMRMRIVGLDTRSSSRQAVARTKTQPFAYVQDYAIASWPQPHLAHLPAGTRAIDTFIGEPAMIGQGHGSAYLRQIAQSLVAEGAPCIVIDPDPSNARARRAYARAGFVEDREVQTPEGRAVLMLFQPHPPATLRVGAAG